MFARERQGLALVRRVLVGKIAHELNNGSPCFGVCDAPEGPVQLQPVAAAKELNHRGFGRFVRVISLVELARRRARSLLVEELRRHTQDMRNTEQPTCANTIDALLVVLNLLVRQTELFPELLLAQAKKYATQTEAAADVDINGVRAAGAFIGVMGFLGRPG